MARTKRRWQSLASGRNAPEFNLLSANSNLKVTLADLCEKRIIIAFLPGVWAPWCRKLLKELNSAKKDFQAKSFCIVAIISQDHEQLVNYVSKNRIRLEVLADSHGVVGKRYGVFDKYLSEPMRISKPAIFILDKNKQIRHAFIGSHLTDRPAVEEILEKASEVIREPVQNSFPFYFFRRWRYAEY